MLFFKKKNTLLMILLATCLMVATYYVGIRAAELIESKSSHRAATLIATEPTDSNLKVAFIGDSGYGANFEAVLALIKNEGAAVVLHQGDFDYELDADGFFAKIDAVLGPNFPYFTAVGNHDVASWATDCGDPDGCYAQFLQARMARMGVTPDHPDLNDQMYAVTYRGLKLVFVGQEASAGDRTYAPYIQRQLVDDPHIWKICSWHRNQHALQLGKKPDDMGWAVYETCRNNGAIIVTGHEHSYSRTKTLTQIEDQTVDIAQHPAIAGVPGNPNRLVVGPGRSFVVVSGLGGQEMRNQDRCTPFHYPYGGEPTCNYIWAKIQTTDQTGGVEQHGALFITFNIDQDPTKAHGYFKTTAGDIIDEFDITRVAAPVGK